MQDGCLGNQPFSEPRIGYINPFLLLLLLSFLLFFFSSSRAGGVLWEDKKNAMPSADMGSSEFGGGFVKNETMVEQMERCVEGE